MLKVAGCLLVIYASFMAGHAVGQLQVRKVSELSELLMCVGMIRDQISYAHLELPELIYECRKRTRGSVRMWLKEIENIMERDKDRLFEDIWSGSMAQLANTSAVDSDTIACLDRLGSVMGSLDTDSQIKQLELAEKMIHIRYEKEAGRTDGIRKISDSMGILGGIFIVLILV